MTPSYNGPVQSPVSTPRRLLVVLPSWVGDAAMATPALRALRELYPESRITYLLREYVRPVIDGAPWHDRLIVVRPRKAKADRPANGGPPRPRGRRRGLVARLRRREFDAAVLLPNSFRSALLVSSAGIRRRIGYDRDGRGLLLTDRLLPMRRKGRYVPVPAVDYYLGLARYLGAPASDRRLRLFTRPADDARANVMLRSTGADGGRPLVVLNPGAATKGRSKLWPAARFAAIADHLVDRHGAAIAVSGSAKERPLLDAVHRAARHQLIDLPAAGCDLTLLKSVLSRSALLVTNDTGARHIAAGVGARVVSLFGPTDPRWTVLDYDRERIIHAADGRMESIDVQPVIEAAEQLLDTCDLRLPIAE